MQTAALYRILDANLDRAREGLRVIEEWCRFGLNNPDLSETCKGLRQELGRLHHPEFRLARDTPGDVGTTLSHPQEQHRADIPAVLMANLCRVQEALRALEEYGKVYDPRMGEAFQQLRYQTYTLESALLAAGRSQRLRQIPLYLVTSPSETLLEKVEGALQGGLRLVQYRDKSKDDPQRLAQAQALKELCHRYAALFIVNDRVDIALAVQADGVHLGQQDLPVATARKLLGANVLIGRSTTNPAELERAIAEQVDYIGVGPTYSTPTKTDKPLAGLDYVAYAARHAPMPWFAIGGIDAQRLPEVIAAGATQVAVVRAIMAAPDPTGAVQKLLAQLSSPAPPPAIDVSAASTGSR